MLWCQRRLRRMHDRDDLNNQTRVSHDKNEASNCKKNKSNRRPTNYEYSSPTPPNRQTATPNSELTLLQRFSEPISQLMNGRDIPHANHEVINHVSDIMNRIAKVLCAPSDATVLGYTDCSLVWDPASRPTRCPKRCLEQRKLKR